MKENFIRTRELSTATTLSKLGFQKVDGQNGVYTFLNTDKIHFSNEVDRSKIQYTNMLYV